LVHTCIFCWGKSSLGYVDYLSEPNNMLKLRLYPFGLKRTDHGSATAWPWAPPTVWIAVECFVQEQIVVKSKRVLRCSMAYFIIGHDMFASCARASTVRHFSIFYLRLYMLFDTVPTESMIAIIKSVHFI